MILTKEQYDEMIDEDPFPYYKHTRISEEEKTLSYLTMNGGKYENLAFAIQNFGPQPFRGTYGTNFQPPGLERYFPQSNIRINAFDPFSLNAPRIPPPGVSAYRSPPPSIAPPGLYTPGPSLPPSSPSLGGPSAPQGVHSWNSAQSYNAPTQSFCPPSPGRRDDRDVPEFKELPLERYESPSVPAHLLPIVGGPAADNAEYGSEADNDGRTRSFMLPLRERERSTPSVRSNETVERTSGRISLTSSRTTPPKP